MENLKMPGYFGSIYDDSLNEIKIVLEKTDVWNKIGTIDPGDENLNVKAKVLFE